MASEINLVLASDGAGIRGLAVAGYSALRASSRPVRLWIVQEGIERDTQRRLQVLWERTGRLEALRFLAPLKLPAWWATRNLPLIACARLRMSSVLPEWVERCVYIDIDVLVGADLSELYAMDMGGCPVAMAVNTGMDRTAEEYVARLHLTPKAYYNSGVMVIDLGLWRQEGAEEAMIASGKTLPSKLWFPDQDIMNHCFRGRIATLDPRWNVRDAGAPLAGNILHFAGGVKPWRVENSQDAPQGFGLWLRAFQETGFEDRSDSASKRFKRKAKMWRAILERSIRSKIPPLARR